MIVWIGLHVIGFILIIGVIVLFVIKEKVKKWLEK
jgi:hypothetical protein